MSMRWARGHTNLQSDQDADAVERSAGRCNKTYYYTFQEVDRFVLCLSGGRKERINHGKRKR